MAEIANTSIDWANAEAVAAVLPRLRRVVDEFADEDEVGGLVSVVGMDVSDVVEALQNNPALRGKIEALILDMETLPLKQGDACPSDEDLDRVNLLSESDESLTTLDTLARKLLDDIEDRDDTRSVSAYYNTFSNYDAKRIDITWNFLLSDPEISEELSRIASLLAKDIKIEDDSKTSQDLAMEDLRSVMGNQPTKYISAKNPANILIGILKSALMERFLSWLVFYADFKELPLIEGGRKVENIDAFERAVALSLTFQGMDRAAYMDMLANPLGQAQTADPDKGESYFRAREGVPGVGMENNFGYVYLDEDQLKKMGIDKGVTADCVTEFRYYNKAYFAVPVGVYFQHKKPEDFDASIDGLLELAAEYPGTPVEDYYYALAAYYQFSVSHVEDGGQPGEDFAKGYHDACYEAEKAWVAYVRYAGENNLPFIHIHPFEKYNTTSTKSHDLALATLNHAETEVYLEAKAKFIANITAFFERSGIAAQHPAMVAETMRLLNSAAILSLGARLGSILKGTIAQNIPNEEAGRADGIVTLCDTAFAMQEIEKGHGQRLDLGDAIGGLAAYHHEALKDPDLFMLHYILEVVSHELNHNSFKGREQSYKGDEKGLGIKLIEEAKATNGLAFAFEDPYNLTDEELIKLRRALPAMMPWSIFRFMKPLLAQYSSHQYLREGAVMLDHALKSGILEVVHCEFDDGGVPVVSDNLDSESGFDFLRYHFDDDKMRDYVSRCAKFMERLAPVYAETQGFNGRLDNTHGVPDFDDIDVWQALNIECVERDLARLVEEKGDSDPDVMELKNKLSRLTPPDDLNISPKVRSLIRISGFGEPARMRTEIQRAFGADLHLDVLEEKVANLKAWVAENYPQI